MSSNNTKLIVRDAGLAVSRNGTDSMALAKIVLALARHCEQLEDRLIDLERDAKRLRTVLKRR